LFASATPGITTDQQGTVEQLFEYDALTGELVRVTKGEGGYDVNGNGVATGIDPEAVAGFGEYLSRSTDFKNETNQLLVSRDGRTVVFRTYGKLSPYATSAEQCKSVYEFHANGPLASGEVHLLSDGRDTGTIPGNGCGNLLAQGAVMDATGENILFSTADALVPTDTDGGQRDLYDARTNGGFTLPRGALCTGEGCAPATPVPGAPATLGFAPEGSATQPPETTPSAPGTPTAPTQPAAATPRVKAPGGASRAAKLRRALGGCHKLKPRSRRGACERRARGRFGVKAMR
jgi:hypothetical protein